MYSEKWKKESLAQEGQSGKSMDFYLQNPKDQQVIISLDYLNPRMIPNACPQPSVHYNLYLSDQDGKNLDAAGISRQAAYGHINIDELAKGDYRVKVVNWGETAGRTDYTLTSYASDQGAKILDSASQLTKELDEAGDKGKQIKERDLEGVIYYDKEDQIVSIRVTKT